MKNNEKLGLAEWVIKEALKNGADEVSVDISSGRGVEVEFRDKKLDKLQEATTNSLSLKVYADQKFSVYSTNDLKKDTLTGFVKEAVAGTKYLSQDEFRKLPDPKYYPKAIEGDLKIKDPGFEKIDTSERIRIASEIEKAALEVSDQIISVSAGYSDGSYGGVLVNSNGFSGEYSETVFSAGAEVTVKDQESGRPADWMYSSVRFFNELPSTEFLGVTAAKRALQKIGQRKIKSGKYTMLVENRAAGRLIGVLRGAMTARSIQQKASFLDGMLEKQIASEKLTVIDDPFIEKGLNSRFFDSEGLAARKRVMIDKGVLKNFFVDNYYGRKVGMELTTSSPSNVLYGNGSRSFDELVRDIKHGIIVNGFIGGNSNSTTGDFSFGIVGLLVENGEIVHPVNEMNLSGNAKEFFATLEEMGNDPYPYSSNKIPSMLFTEASFSGI